MAEIHDLNPTDASNTVRFPENQAPSTVNNGARALEGLIARYFFDNDSSVLATLSGSLITITANRNSLTLTGTTSNYVANFMQAFAMGANPNTGPVRATIDGVGPISIRDNRGASLSSSILLAGTRALIIKDATNDYFRLVWPHHESADTNTQISQANQAAIEGETNENTYIPPDLLKHSPGVAKAWVMFDGTGVVAIDADYNVTSITDNGTGDYTANLTVAFSSANFAAALSAFEVNAFIVTKTTTTIQIRVTNSSEALADSADVNIIMAGDQ